MIIVGIDDTDVVGAPGTNKLARRLRDQLADRFPCHLIVRHQLLRDRQVPFTSKNSSASLHFDIPSSLQKPLVDSVRTLLQQWFVPGSDPGICATEQSAIPDCVVEFGRRCQQTLVTQSQARQLARSCEIHLESLGGTEDGVIGALAAVGLARDKGDGRVVAIGNRPDSLSNVQSASQLRQWSVELFLDVTTGASVDCPSVDIGKHFRPNLRNGKLVLFVELTPGGWRAVRFS